MKDPQLGPSIEVSQERAIEELEEVTVEKKHEGRSPLHTCIHGTEAFCDKSIGYKVGHCFSVATSFPDVLQKQLLQQLVM